MIKHNYKSIAISKLKTKNNNNDIRKTKKEIINTKDSNEHTINNLKLNYENVNNNFESNSTNSPAPNNKNDKKAVEVFKDTKNLSKSLKLFDIKYIIGLSIIFLVLIFGFLKRKDNL